ncbi:MAG: (Fe-S)-binding protein [Thermodesulfobacteriota bacterium]
MGAYDPRGREIARSVATVLQKAGVSLGVLTEGECADGNDVRAMGETPLFGELAKKNIAAFDRARVKKIITLSPHAFHAFKNDYPAFGGHYQVFHYTQLLAFAMGHLAFTDNPAPQQVTFHDPCYLGRHNGDYESPRMVLRAVPGIQLLEMERNRKNALCCGGGGGNFFTDILGGAAQSPARTRAMEAEGTGAQILAVACPQCAIMLEDAVKTAGVADRLQVREVTEVIGERLAV